LRTAAGQSMARRAVRSDGTARSHRVTRPAAKRDWRRRPTTNPIVSSNGMRRVRRERLRGGIACLIRSASPRMSVMCHGRVGAIPPLHGIAATWPTAY
jgi:hypothetical protein